MFVEQDVQEAEMIRRWNRAFRVLSAEPRRQIVCALMEAPPDRALSLPEAANPPYLLADPEELAVELIHTHLPVMAEARAVEWHREPLSVERGPAFEEVESVMAAIWGTAEDLPQQLREGCQRLEEGLEDERR